MIFHDIPIPTFLQEEKENTNVCSLIFVRFAELRLQSGNVKLAHISQWRNVCGPSSWNREIKLIIQKVGFLTNLLLSGGIIFRRPKKGTSTFTWTCLQGQWPSWQNGCQGSLPLVMHCVEESALKFHYESVSRSTRDQRCIPDASAHMDHLRNEDPKPLTN